MKKVYILIVLAGLLIPPACAQHPTQDKNWALVFEDDFSIDFTYPWGNNKWYKHEGAHNAGKGGSEVQSFSIFGNVKAENGKLVIETKKEPSPACVPGCNEPNRIYKYTSGGISSRETYKYGYFQIYAKLPGTTGYWPGFWLWENSPPEQTSNCWFNEIDIFEAYGDNPNAVESRVHWEFRCPPDHPINNENIQHPCNFSTGYHWYAVEWDRAKITWYVDGRPVRQIINNVGGVGIQNPMRILINTWLASFNSSRNLIKTGVTQFPNWYYVDQVNVYKLKCDTDKNITVIPNFTPANSPSVNPASGYYYAVKKSITLGSNTTIPQNSNISLRATDFIQLNPGFESPLGTELFLGTGPCE